MKAKSARKPRKASLTPLLQKWHRNDIFKAIQAVGIDPREFDLDDSGAEVRVKHRSSPSCFTVSRESGYYVGQSVVADGPVWPFSPCSWLTLMPRVSTWLEEVKHDLATPDLWAELQREAKLLGAGSNELTKNTPFTLDEQEEIARRLQELAKYASRTYTLSTAQMQTLDAKLDYLVKASSRLGRKDWLIMFIGAILGYILSVPLPPESARDFLLPLLRGIGHLYPELPIN
jgi:hypothetical protein